MRGRVTWHMATTGDLFRAPGFRLNSAPLAGRFPPLEPPAKRLLRLTRPATRYETLHTDIFIQIWPVDPLATGNEPPVGPLRRCPVRQAGEPREWHRDRPAIRKFRDQSIIAHTYAQGQRFSEFSPRSTHAMTLTKKPRLPRPVFRYVQFPRESIAMPGAGEREVT
jgi:hypothetical protein